MNRLKLDRIIYRCRFNRIEINFGRVYNFVINSTVKRYQKKGEVMKRIKLNYITMILFFTAIVETGTLLMRKEGV